MDLDHSASVIQYFVSASTLVHQPPPTQKGERYTHSNQASLAWSHPVSPLLPFLPPSPQALPGSQVPFDFRFHFVVNSKTKGESFQSEDPYP